MQAKDIATIDFVKAVIFVGLKTESRMALRWDVQAELAGHPELIGKYGIDRSAVEAAIPAKVMMAKARRLMNQGILDGCPCGCRGDYEVMPHVAAGLGLVPAPGNQTGSHEPFGYWIVPV